MLTTKAPPTLLPRIAPPPVGTGRHLSIDSAEFPFEALSKIAEAESWRKEIYRPVYHLHKWWAQRLGSVFRAILLGAFTDSKTDIESLFFSPVRLSGRVVFDPFMGSGTTLGEALKLGMSAIGRDINPVAHLAVSTALDLPSRREVISAYTVLTDELAPLIRPFYRTNTSDGQKGEALYYFWVKHLPCPSCSARVDLFSKYVFSRHAYPKKHPEAKALCPRCESINCTSYDAHELDCSNCGLHFDPSRGPASGQKATCPACANTFGIAARVRELGHPPEHRMYAKLVLTDDGEKKYSAITEADHASYGLATRKLAESERFYPDVEIRPGYNTNQVLNYCYRRWHEMFNDRQLYILGLVGKRIRSMDDLRMRRLFCCLFSGAIEFNNMFTSFKGEGTGAVRHMFSHHILKPERAPLEANVWGTPKSSGSISTLFQSRVLRALSYCENPSEVIPPEPGSRKSQKVDCLSDPLFFHPCEHPQAVVNGENRLHLSCGDSGTTNIPSNSVDAVVTDPPFFDNVNYSQLADFFHVWQRAVMGVAIAESTRSENEVQHSEVAEFASRLQRVFSECRRVLKPNGRLVFTYHHSRSDGWASLFQAIADAEFTVSQCHPVKAEMSVAAPKSQAKDPIDFDVIIVCKKRLSGPVIPSHSQEPSSLLESAKQPAAEKLSRMRKAGFKTSRNDCRVVLMAEFLRILSIENLPPQTIGETRTGVEEAISDLASMVAG